MTARRRTYFVDPPFQLRYGLLFFGLSFCAAAIVGAVAFYGLRQTHAALMALPPLQYSPGLGAMIEAQYRALAFLLIGLFAILALFCTVFGIYITHRVAGPLVKLRSTMDEVAAGNHFARITFRRNDEFKDVATKFNEMMDSLQEHFRSKPEA
jgi:HAMP domain-containing protein